MQPIRELGPNKSKQKQIIPSKNPWICLDPFGRIGTFQRVTEEKIKKIPSRLRSRRGLWTKCLKPLRSPRSRPRAALCRAVSSLPSIVPRISVWRKKKPKNSMIPFVAGDPKRLTGPPPSPSVRTRPLTTPSCPSRSPCERAVSARKRTLVDGVGCANLAHGRLRLDVCFCAGGG